MAFEMLANSMPRATLHSQTVRTVHPNRFSSRRARRSRCRLRRSLLRQYVRFVRGETFRHPCPCQKHPWTNITARKFGRRKSGDPGSFGYALNTMPRPRSALTARCSGPVPLDLTACMVRCRCRGVRLSDRSFLPLDKRCTRCILDTVFRISHNSGMLNGHRQPPRKAW
jgi:hypothetical protein